ncbi:MAG: hypothetical protein Q7R81_07815 [Candidatus Peregrinibacteria bacterium]|nr:hypothetical protein [Candidatus Peregrinibacteria bacterium]
MSEREFVSQCFIHFSIPPTSLQEEEAVPGREQVAPEVPAEPEPAHMVHVRLQEAREFMGRTSRVLFTLVRRYVDTGSIRLPGSHEEQGGHSRGVIDEMMRFSERVLTLLQILEAHAKMPRAKLMGYKMSEHFGVSRNMMHLRWKDIGLKGSDFPPMVSAIELMRKSPMLGPTVTKIEELAAASGESA